MPIVVSNHLSCSMRESRLKSFRCFNLHGTGFCSYNNYFKEFCKIFLSSRKLEISLSLSFSDEIYKEIKFNFLCSLSYRFTLFFIGAFSQQHDLSFITEWILTNLSAKRVNYRRIVSRILRIRLETLSLARSRPRKERGPISRNGEGKRGGRVRIIVQSSQDHKKKEIRNLKRRLNKCCTGPWNPLFLSLSFFFF